MPLNSAPTFSPANGSGSLIIPMGSQDLLWSATLQLDGKIVLAGESFTANGAEFSVLLLNADGSLDTTFNGTGKLLLAVGEAAGAYSAVSQPDGKILTAGYSWNGTDNDFGVARLNADGSLDTTFNETGTLVFPMGSGPDYVQEVTLQPDGKIVIAGHSWNGNNYDFGIARLNADGSLDTTFNNTGMLLLPVGSADDLAQSVVVQPDGKIVIAGFTWNGSNYDFGLARLNTDGSLDTTFNDTGKLILPMGSGNDVGQSVVVQPDGRIVVAGESVNGRSYDFGVARLNADGSLDTTFNETGKLVLPVGSGRDLVQSVALQADGKILVAGQSLNLNGNNEDFSVVRLNTDGSLDTTFGGSGKLVLPLGDGGGSVIAQPDGRIVVAGYTGFFDETDFSIVRLNADGSLDTEFNGNAINTLGGTIAYTENAAAVALDTSVSIYDANLATLADGAGNYDGSDVSLSRSGGASSDDVFSRLGNLNLSAGNAVLSGVTIGTYTNSAGTLIITFNSNATQARVNEVLSSIGYANSSDAPPASIQIAWTFNDGNDGGQGTGGPLTGAGTTTVNITAVNDALSGSISIFGSPGIGATLAAINLLSDADGLGTMNYQWHADGSDIAGATNSTLLLTEAEFGKSITVEASYVDGGGTLESVTSTPTAPVFMFGVAIKGTNGNDNLVGTAGNDHLNGERGKDKMTGGLGDDTYVVDQSNDVVVEAPNGGMDQVFSSASYSLSANVENLTLTGTSLINATGNSLNNIIVGSGVANVLTGALGADTLTGGLGADRFVVNAVAESPASPGMWDAITDFASSQGDRIDVSGIDANTTKGMAAARDQAFTFVGSDGFTAAGQLRFDSTAHLLYGNTDGNVNTVELAIELVGVNAVNPADLIL